MTTAHHARPRATVPTFAQYVPLVRDAVGDGTRRVYGSYWNRVVDCWSDHRLDEIAPPTSKQLVEHTRTRVLARGNIRGWRSAAGHLIAALHCLYRHAADLPRSGEGNLIADIAHVRSETARGAL